MSCYDPIAGFPDYDELSKNGKRIYRLEGRFHPEMREIDPNVIKIPCGKCLGCRLDYSRSWADRMILELASMSEPKAIFVTLTYDNDHITFYQGEDLEDAPVGYTLNKRDVQLFFKKLRKHFQGISIIRFFLAGEYGPKTNRPHYHAIIFGIGLKDFEDKRLLGVNELGQPFYTSKELENIWDNGFISLSDVSYNTCAYVSRYVMKKAFNVTFEDGRVPEFSLMSRRPGLGYYYYENHKECAENQNIYLPSVKVAVPRYFLDKLKVDKPEVYDKISMQRVKAASDRELLKLQRTDLSYIELKEMELNELLDKTKILFNLRGDL